MYVPHEFEHADYPHQGNGDLYDCPACELITEAEQSYAREEYPEAMHDLFAA